MGFHNSALTVAGAALDASASFATDKLFIGRMEHVAIELTVPAGPVGTLTVQVSDDDGQQGPGQPGGATTDSTMNWVDVSPAEAISGTTNSPFTWDYSDCPHRWIRLNYTRTSGSGTMTGRASVKGSY